MASDSGEEDQNKYAEADRLEAGGFDPLGGKLTSGNCAFGSNGVVDAQTCSEGYGYG